QQLQPLPRQQQQQQQPFNIGTPVSVASLPPGLNVLQQQQQQQQQQGVGLNRPLASQLPKHLTNQSMPPIFL
ncbi:hypothetical protein NE704_15600, partial [[Ruminococcus] gnavus]|nr:hypothetical protein [Mediterraneibacter gnavus]